MNHTADRLLRLEFELRIFVSLGIVACICAVSAIVSSGAPAMMVILGTAAGIDPGIARTAGYLLLAVLMGFVSAFRMWAGSELTARRVMAFRVQTDTLRTSGPYLLVRNPIYLADFVAMSGFTLCLPAPGLLMPLLFLAHYMRLIRYEEESLSTGFKTTYSDYSRSVPRLLPSFRSVVALPKALKGFAISAEGFRHNALYVLFVPGFVAAAWSGEFLIAAVVGIPGVADWAIIHTRIGVRQ